MPYKAAKAIAAQVAWPVRFSLTPIFGNDFPSLCKEVHQIPKNPVIVIDPAIIREAEKDKTRWLADPQAFGSLAARNKKEGLKYVKRSNPIPISPASETSSFPPQTPQHHRQPPTPPSYNSQRRRSIRLRDASRVPVRVPVIVPGGSPPTALWVPPYLSPTSSSSRLATLSPHEKSTFRHDHSDNPSLSSRDHFSLSQSLSVLYEHRSKREQDAAQALLLLKGSVWMYPGPRPEMVVAGTQSEETVRLPSFMSLEQSLAKMEEVGTQGLLSLKHDEMATVSQTSIPRRAKRRDEEGAKEGEGNPDCRKKRAKH
jgi:hypothetical protein